MEQTKACLEILPGTRGDKPGVLCQSLALERRRWRGAVRPGATYLSPLILCRFLEGLAPGVLSR